MRTTVTLDPDVASAIERIRKSEGRRFKHVLNDVLRLGLSGLSGKQQEHSPESPTGSRDLGELLIDIADVSAAIALAEGEEHR